MGLATVTQRLGSSSVAVVGIGLDVVGAHVTVEPVTGVGVAHDLGRRGCIVERGGVGSWLEIERLSGSGSLIAAAVVRARFYLMAIEAAADS